MPALAVALLLAGGCAMAQIGTDAAQEDQAPRAAGKPQPALPAQELTEALLYELLLAEIALQRGDAELAANTYTELAGRTGDPRIARRAVEVANIARSPQLALDAARAWHEADPGSLQALQTLAALLVRAHRVEDAEPFLEKLLASDGTAAANGFMQLGRLLDFNPDKQANLRLVRALAAKYPELAQAHLAQAQASLAANEDAAALAEARRAAQLRPDWEAAVLFEAQVLQRQSPAQAGAALASFLEKYPKSREVRLGYARLLAGERKYAEARAEFEKLLAAFPDNGDVLYAVGLLALQLKDFTTAEVNLKRLLDSGFRDPNAVRFTLGQAAEEQKHWDVAIGWYQSIQRGDQFLPARMRIAGVMAKQGKMADARAYLRAQQASGEQQIQLLIAEAQLLREANQNTVAFELLGKALEAQPEQPELLYDHALTAEKLERFEILESNLRKLIQIKPDHAHAYNALGYSFAERNLHLAEARRLVERALELSPGDYYIIDSLGWVLFRMGDLKGAAAQLQRAYHGRPDGEIGAHLGEVLWMLGERAEAERIWQEALKNHPANETLQKTVKRLRR